MILGIDSSAVTAGCALYDGKIIAEQFLNNGHTHSETMLPMVESMLKNAGVSLADLDSIAVTAGPGSFTGLRIGIAAVKGMAVGAKKPCIAVSTLEAIAYNFIGFDRVVCACMDARCGQVYNALFKTEGGTVSRLCEDRAIRAEELSKELSDIEGNIVLAGDGAELMHNFTDRRYELAPYPLRYQRGSGVCLAAAGRDTVNAAALMPTYLRLPQAERERLAREKSGEV
ncbi:MAG: tRNA (adenosine(37)-N6)-threonylcarbamoyltransferase complex dimerization subunit type 1 TsaB [Oscillospiraceae bacterium]|nr:tRNA (adenosine(37)-N6)-threonylcarbamoyltransferase complex dimerization subunit type 1 TsaB [Oscillospiraceae bacterium]